MFRLAVTHVEHKRDILEYAHMKHYPTVRDPKLNRLAQNSLVSRLYGEEVEARRAAKEVAEARLLFKRRGPQLKKVHLLALVSCSPWTTPCGPNGPVSQVGPQSVATFAASLSQKKWTPPPEVQWGPRPRIKLGAARQQVPLVPALSGSGCLFHDCFFSALSAASV